MKVLSSSRRGEGEGLGRWEPVSIDKWHRDHCSELSMKKGGEIQPCFCTLFIHLISCIISYIVPHPRSHNIPSTVLASLSLFLSELSAQLPAEGLSVVH